MKDILGYLTVKDEYPLVKDWLYLEINDDHPYILDRLDLIEKGILRKEKSGGRSTNYEINEI